MKRFFLFLSFSALLLQADSYVLIANKDLKLTNISRLYLKQIYLKKHRYFRDVKLIPVNLDVQDAARKSFEKEILKMSRNRLREFWIMQHYEGVRPPLVMHSSKSMIKFVAKIKGALGYIPEKNFSSQENVKIIYRWSD